MKSFATTFNNQNNNTDDIVIYNTADLGKMFSIGKNNAYALMNSNGFPSFKIGRKLFVEKAALQGWLKDIKYKKFMV